MIVYATLEGSTVLTFASKELAPEDAKCYSVDCIEQLIEKDGMICVDKNIQSVQQVVHALRNNIQKESELKLQILKHMIEKEMVQKGIITTTSINDDSYLKILLEYKDVIKSKS